MTAAHPTPLERFDIFAKGYGPHDAWLANRDAIRAFLSSPLIQALSDPATAAWVGVLVEKRVELMEMEGKATAGPWEKDYNGTGGHIKSTAPHEKGDTPTVAIYESHLTRYYMTDDEVQGNGHLIVATRNTLHDARLAFDKAAEQGERR